MKWRWGKWDIGWRRITYGKSQERLTTRESTQNSFLALENFGKTQKWEAGWETDVSSCPLRIRKLEVKVLVTHWGKKKFLLGSIRGDCVLGCPVQTMGSHILRYKNGDIPTDPTVVCVADGASPIGCLKATRESFHLLSMRWSDLNQGQREVTPKSQESQC